MGQADSVPGRRRRDPADHGVEDLGAEFTPELREQEERQRQAIARNKQR